MITVFSSKFTGGHFPSFDCLSFSFSHTGRNDLARIAKEAFLHLFPCLAQLASRCGWRFVLYLLLSSGEFRSIVNHFFRRIQPLLEFAYFAANFPSPPSKQEQANLPYGKPTFQTPTQRLRWGGGGGLGAR